MEHRSDCEQLIADLVENHFGIEKHLKGCTYLKEAIEIAVQNPIVSIMKLYELVGLRHGCNAESGGVCPDIRNVTFHICKIDEIIWKSTCLMETSGRCFLCQK